MCKKLDIVLFGATGFTGIRAIPFIEKFSKTKHLTWGVAGRSEEKLKNVLEDCEKQTGISFGKISIIIADVKNEQSLKEMAQRARIIINCCGPYNFYGEPVIKACVEEGTHHVDVSAEIQFLEKIQLRYHKKAQEKGAYIIGACGYASIPIDLGVVYMQKNFTGTLNSVVANIEYWEEGSYAAKGSAFNYSTWQSIIHTLGAHKEIEEIRQELFPNRLPTFKPQLKLKAIPHKPKLVDGWAVPFDGTDISVARRSQRLFYEQESKRPVQIETYLTVKTFLYSILFCIGGLLLTVLTKFQCSLNLILKYPETLTFGLIGRELPSEERIENTYFRTTFYGEGWKETLPGANDQYITPPNRAIAAAVKGRNPGYGAANICLVLAAITVITETDKLPSSGGVYPPGYAFANTSLVEQLKENDVSFDILFEKDL